MLHLKRAHKRAHVTLKKRPAEAFAALSLAMQARSNAGEVEPGNFMQLKLPDGTSRCQGMVGLHTQCPKSLECEEHHDLNQRFLNGFQLLKKAQTLTAGIDYKERDLEVQRMKLRLRDMAKNKYAVPFKVCIFLSWDNWLRQRAGRICRSRHFDNLTLLCIAVNCAVLAIDRPRRSELEAVICEWILYVLTFYFW